MQHRVHVYPRFVPTFPDVPNVANDIGVRTIVGEHVYPRFVPGYTRMFPNTLLVEDAENDEQCVGEHLGTCWGNMWEHFPFHIKKTGFLEVPDILNGLSTLKNPFYQQKMGG